MSSKFSKLRDQSYLLMLGAYLAILIFSFAYYGILFQFSLSLYFLALLPITFVIGRTTRFVKELTPFLVLLLSYEALNGIAGARNSLPVIAFTNPFTSSSGFSLVATVQSVFQSDTVTDIASIFYGLHFLLVAVLAILLWYSNKTLYRRYSFALIASSYIALIFYVFLPSAPPWYTGVASNLLQNPVGQSTSGLISNLANIGELMESDKFAAFPSLHAAYIILFCFFTVKAKRLYALVSVPITVGVLFSTLYLGQHYVLDLVGGGVLALGCAMAAQWLVKGSSHRLAPLRGLGLAGRMVEERDGPNSLPSGPK